MSKSDVDDATCEAVLRCADKHIFERKSWHALQQLATILNAPKKLSPSARQIGVARTMRVQIYRRLRQFPKVIEEVENAIAQCDCRVCVPDLLLTLANFAITKLSPDPTNATRRRKLVDCHIARLEGDLVSQPHDVHKIMHVCQLYIDRVFTASLKRIRQLAEDLSTWAKLESYRSHGLVLPTDPLYRKYLRAGAHLYHLAGDPRYEHAFLCELERVTPGGVLGPFQARRKAIAGDKLRLFEPAIRTLDKVLVRYGEGCTGLPAHQPPKAISSLYLLHACLCDKWRNDIAQTMPVPHHGSVVNFCHLLRARASAARAQALWWDAKNIEAFRGLVTAVPLAEEKTSAQPQAAPKTRPPTPMPLLVLPPNASPIPKSSFPPSMLHPVKK